MTYKRKKYHFGDTHLKRRWRVRSRKRDLDQIDQDLQPKQAEKLLNQEIDIDKPGDAQFYCLHCASVDVRPVLSPTLDLAKKFENVENLQNNVNKRCMDIDVADLKTLWEAYVELDSIRNTLENKRTEIATEIKNLKKSKNAADQEKSEGLRLHGRIAREDLKKLMNPFWEIQEKLMINCLSLPNELHKDTPEAEEKILFKTNSLSQNFPTNNHLKIAEHLINYRDPHWYYLKKEAAHFDLAVMYFFLENLKSFNFIPIVAPDFSHSAVVEGCQVSTNNSIKLQPLQENLNIVGGSSIFPFCTLYAKQDTPVKKFPVKHIAGGKKYMTSEKPGLFGATQRTRVEYFQMAESLNDINEQFNLTLEQLKTLYEKLGWDFKIVLVPAVELNVWESLRASFQMFSPSLKSFVEIGHLSLSGTFISERLSMRFIDKDGNKEFCQVVSGNAIDVTSVLACLLEQNVADLVSKPLTPYSFQ